MIVKTADADRFVEHPPAKLVAALLFGPDQGLAREEADNAAAVQCYADTPEGAARVVQKALRAEGFSISDEALDNAVSRLGPDRGLIRREIEKLALYAQGKKRVVLDDVRAVLGDEAE